MRRTRSILCVVALVCCLLFVLPASADADTQAAEQINLTANASAEEVFVSQSVDVTATVAVSEAQDRRVRVSGATLVDENGSVRSRLSLDRAVSPGDRTELTFEDLTIRSPGRNDYTVRVDVSRLFDADTQLSAETTVVGNDPAPVVDATSIDRPGPTDRTLNVSLGNANDGSLSRVHVSVQTPSASNITVLDRSDAVPVIEPGETRTVSFDLRGVESGVQSFRIATRFETADGETWTRTERLSVTFAKTRVTIPVDDAPVELTGVSTEGTTPARVSGQVSNAGEQPLVGVTVSVADGPNATALDEEFIGTVEPGSSGRLTMVRGALNESRTTAPVEVGYTIDGTRYRTVVDVGLERPSAGQADDTRVAPVRLTGVSAQGTAPARVSGQVSNAGERPLVGVTVSVADGPNATALDEEFIGTVEPGSSGRLTMVRGALNESRTTAPVEVGYTIDGTRYRTVVDVGLERPSAGQTDDTQPSPDPGTPENGNGGSAVLSLGTTQLLSLGLGAAFLTAAIAFVYVRRT